VFLIVDYNTFCCQYRRCS